MTKRHFEAMAEIVHSILVGEWTDDTPVWSDAERIGCTYHTHSAYERAVQTAEAFIILAQAFNPAFDSTRFLQACGLTSADDKCPCEGGHPERCPDVGAENREHKGKGKRRTSRTS